MGFIRKSAKLVEYSLVDRIEWYASVVGFPWSISGTGPMSRGEGGEPRSVMEYRERASSKNIVEANEVLARCSLAAGPIVPRDVTCAIFCWRTRATFSFFSRGTRITDRNRLSLDIPPLSKRVSISPVREFLENSCPRSQRSCPCCYSRRPRLESSPK